MNEQASHRACWQHLQLPLCDLGQVLQRGHAERGLESFQGNEISQLEALEPRGHGGQAGRQGARHLRRPEPRVRSRDGSDGDFWSLGQVGGDAALLLRVHLGHLWARRKRGIKLLFGDKEGINVL